MYRAIPACFILVAFLMGCTRDQAAYNPCPNCPVISFKRDIIPIFKTDCATANCHAGPLGQDRVTLDSASAYADATKPGTGYVIPYNANYSLLYTQLIPGATNHMPQPGGPVSQVSPCDMQLIYCWIDQGALNN